MLNRFPRLQGGSQQLQLIISRRNSTVTYLKLHRQHHTFTFRMKKHCIVTNNFLCGMKHYILLDNKTAYKRAVSIKPPVNHSSFLMIQITKMKSLNQTIRDTRHQQNTSQWRDGIKGNIPCPRLKCYIICSYIRINYNITEGKTLPHVSSLLVLFFVSTKSASVSVLGLFMELRLILANKKNRERGTWFW